MTKLQLAARMALPALVTAVLAFAAAPQVHADAYDYGYGPVYNSYPAVSGTTCPNGQCSGAYYSPSFSASYPAYTTQTCPSGTCPSGTCGTCPNGSCGLRGQCSGGQCSFGQCSSGQCANGQCPNGQCANGQCTTGSCRSGRCGTCPNGDCERGNCSGNCPNGQCTTRYRGPVDPLNQRAARSYDRPDYGAPDAASYRQTWSSERPSYRDRDYRDEPVSRRSWRNDPRPTSRDSDLDSPFYN